MRCAPYGARTPSGVAVMANDREPTSVLRTVIDYVVTENLRLSDRSGNDQGTETVLPHGEGWIMVDDNFDRARFCRVALVEEPQFEEAVCPDPLDAARKLAAWGLAVHPVRADKRPASPHGYKDASADPETVTELWRRYPAPLIGVATGEASGISVLDIDTPRHSEARQWLAQNHWRLPKTRVHGTRSGGVHFVFRHRPGLRCSAGRPVPGVDTRGCGGFIVWWPAAGYGVEHLDTLVDWPPWLLEEVAPPPPRMPPPSTARAVAGVGYVAGALRRGIERVATAPEGRRNETLNAETFALARLALDADILAEAMLAAARACGLPEFEARRTIQSALTARRGRP